MDAVCLCMCLHACVRVWKYEINRIAITGDERYRISTAGRYPYEWHLFNLTLTHHCVTR